MDPIFRGIRDRARALRNPETSGPIGIGILAGVVLTAVATLAVEHFVFQPYASALQRQVIVTVQPAEWHMVARCRNCGATWSIDGGTR